MAIQVFCDCGNTVTVGPDLAGKKIRCKACNEVLKIPKVPMEKSDDSGGNYEVVKDDAETIFCPACGATCAPEDTACLACGYDLSGARSLGPLDAIPRPVLVGAVLLILFGALFFVAKSLYESSRPGAHAANGQQFLNEELYDEAEREFKKALEYVSNYPDAIVGLAMVGVRTEDSALIKRYAPKAVDLLDDDPRERGRLRLAYAWLLLDEDESRRARNEAIDARDDDPDLAGEVHALVGLTALQGNPPQTDEALSELKDASDAGVEDYRVYRELAKLLRDEEQDYQAGRIAAERALKLKEGDAELWLLAADLRHLTGDAKARKAGLREAVKLDPKNADARFLLAEVHHAEGQPEMALDEARQAAELDPQRVEIQVSIGRILLAMGQPEKAKAELEKALSLGESWQGNFLLGKAMVELGEVKEGMTQIRNALNRQKENVELHLEAGRIAIDAGDATGAASLLTRMVATESRNYDAHILLAEAYSKEARGIERNTSRIQELLKQAIAIDGGRRDAPLLLGTHLMSLPVPQPEPAMKAFSQGLDHNPRDVELLYYKGAAAIQAKLWDEAIDAIKACLEIDSSYKDAQVKLEIAQEGKFYEQNE